MPRTTMQRKAGWTTVAFGDVVRQVKDQVDPEESGLERYVAGEHMDTDDLRIRRWGDIGDGYLGPAFHMRFKPGQVLYGSRRTYLRKIAVADFEGITANTTYVLESADPQVLLPELLPFIMQTEAFTQHSVRESKGSVNPYVNFSDLAPFEFALPPIDQQRRMLEALVAAQATGEGLLKSERALASLYDSWVESELCATEWPEAIASELLDRATVGIVIQPAALYVEKGGVPALRSLNVLPNRISWEECIQISSKGHEENQKSALSAGDVVIVRSGRPGDAAVVPERNHGLNAIDLIVSTPGPRLRSGYFCRFLNSRAGRRQFASGIAGTAQLHFNVGLFKKLRIPLPPVAEQVRFEKEAARFDAAVATIEERLTQTKALRQVILEECVRP